MGDGIRKDAGIVTKNRGGKQKSRLAPAFLFGAKQAEPVRDYFGAGFFFDFFFVVMVRSPVKVVKKHSDQVAKEVYAKCSQTWNRQFVRICKPIVDADISGRPTA